MVKFEADIQRLIEKENVYANASKLNVTRGKHFNIGGWMCQSFNLQVTDQFFEELKAIALTSQIFAKLKIQL